MAQIPISLAHTAPRAPLPMALASQECSAWGRGNQSEGLKAALSPFRNTLAQGRASSTGTTSSLVLPQLLNYSNPSSQGCAVPCAPVPTWLWHSSRPCPPASPAQHKLDQPIHSPEGCHRHSSSSSGLSPRGMRGQTGGVSARLCARLPDLALRMAEWLHGAHVRLLGSPGLYQRGAGAI